MNKSEGGGSFSSLEPIGGAISSVRLRSQRVPRPDMANMKQEPEISEKTQARCCSIAWKYYIKNESNATVYCRLCKKTFKFSSNTANMIKHLRVKHRLNIPTVANGGERQCTEEPTEGSMDMDLPPQRHPGSHSGPTLRRRMQRFLPFSVRRTSKVWNHYTQLSLHRVECNHCKRQLSFHNSTTSMREHLGRKHSIREGAVPPHNTTGIPTPAALHSHIQTSLHGNRCNTTGNAPLQPALPITVKEEQEEVLPAEMAETKPTRTTYAPDCAAGSGEMSSTAGGSSNRSCSRACSNKRAEVLTDLILEMVFRDLRPLSVVEERGFKLLLSCLEPNYPVPSPSLLGSLLWHRYHVLKQCLQQHLQTSLASHCLTLCTEYWRSVDGCGVDGDGQYYLTVSTHFVDSHWRLARCVLETRPIAEFKGSSSERGRASFADTLRAVLSEFQLPENFIFCVVHDTPSGPESRGQENMAINQGYPQEFAGPSHPPPSNLPEGWAPLLCAGRALKLCVQEGLCVETVRQALADARAIVLHFQHNVNASTALSQKAEAVNKESACLVLNDPGRWTTAIEMCESLLELKWVISSVLEEQKVATNLADHQWRLIHELVPVLKTVRIAASFLSEDINGPISALMPCLQGVSRLLGQKIAECTCPVVKGVMERIRAGMDKRWSLSDEDALLDSSAVLSSFLDPRFKELRFLSPHARSKLHDKVKELLSVQPFTSDEQMNAERRQSMEMEETVDERGEPADFELDDSLPIPAMASLDSPESCGSVEEGDSVELQTSEPCVAISSPEQVNENTLGSPFKNANDRKRRNSGTSMTSPLRGDLQLMPRIRMSPLPQSMYDIILGEDPTERMPEIHQQLENYIAEPLCRRSLSPLQWWRNKEHRFPAVARLARKYLSIPATAVSADRTFAPRESPVTQRRATLGSKHLDHILFLHQNTDYVDQLKGDSSTREIEQWNSVSGNQSRESLYQTLVSYESKVCVSEEES
ncbi:uncharacterized protein LOC109074825 isoform X2 [Cyprinus carpio]|uniref:Uncharacterized protein LOC109074825 isoform X2 n=1 Tax=Cyprinus carpio TaxID=7962 RepID=A0A9R0AWF9_CYPCA|nr:uncharacterized protein LOC109074825 isoform X2 [Cyprinus carpio]